MFRDEAAIEVIAGKGGDGLMSFRREKFVPHGGPDGGDGGDGGSVILRATANLNSLLEIGRAYRYEAGKGTPGGPRKKTGARGDDLELDVPVGTLVYDAERGNMLRDLAQDGQELVVALGGKGGQGNVRFATAINQVPRKATRGTSGERRKLRLELKLVAEVGLIGLPNAGKSTFLSRVTAARPKIADYPFTPLDPQVAIADIGGYDTLVIADLPGLIEGAAAGVGLGHRFLKHVERCGVLLHLVDVTGLEDPREAFQTIERELEEFSTALFQKPRIVVATKVESDEHVQRAQELAQSIGQPVLQISSVAGKGLSELLEAARQLVRDAATPS